MVIAPNGAIMGGFPAYQLTDDSKLVDAVGGKASEQALKALQQKNMVALCVQSKKTADNMGAMRSVAELLDDPKYGETTAVVMADPLDPADAKFVTKLGVDPSTPLATTSILAPPGSVIFTFQGGLSKGRLVTEVQAAVARKSGGCCPPGSGKTCGPTGGTTPTKTVGTTPSPGQVQKVPPTAASTTSATATGTSTAAKQQGK
jgi:hypothetical protein